jgi:hypothetical protein
MAASAPARRAAAEPPAARWWARRAAALWLREPAPAPCLPLPVPWLEEDAAGVLAELATGVTSTVWVLAGGAVVPSATAVGATSGVFFGVFGSRLGACLTLPLLPAVSDGLPDSSPPEAGWPEEPELLGVPLAGADAPLASVVAVLWPSLPSA